MADGFSCLPSFLCSAGILPAGDEASRFVEDREARYFPTRTPEAYATSRILRLRSLPSEASREGGSDVLRRKFYLPNFSRAFSVNPAALKPYRPPRIFYL